MRRANEPTVAVRASPAELAAIDQSHSPAGLHEIMGTGRPDDTAAGDAIRWVPKTPPTLPLFLDAPAEWVGRIQDQRSFPGDKGAPLDRRDHLAIDHTDRA